jgi:uncharacterized protein involved in exopolysaccharide biosynthesis
MATMPPHVYIDDGTPGHADSTSRRNKRRFAVFATVFVLGCAAGLTYTFGRPAVYESTARLLVKPPAIDNPADVSGNAKAVALESHLLTSHPLLATLQERLSKTGPLDGLPQTLGDLRGMLRVTAFRDANVLELKAEAPAREVLAVLVNTWMDVYLERHAESKTVSRVSTNQALQEQRQALEQRVSEKRGELDRFRRRHDIVSLRAEENKVVAKLTGLNDSLKRATEAEAQAEAELNAMQSAIAEGKPIVHVQDQRVVANLERRATALKEKLEEFELKFTPEYMALDPDIGIIVSQLALVEERLAEARRESQRIVLTEMEQKFASAKQVIVKLEGELSVFKQTAADFTTRFAEHTALQEELAQLESRYRETQDRLVRQDVNEGDQTTQVEVLERAVMPEYPAYPDYLRDAGISFGGSLLLGLLAAGLFDFFNRPAPQLAAREGWLLRPDVVDARFSKIAEEVAAPVDATDDLPPAEPVPVLGRREIRELTESEVGAIVEAADQATRVLLGFLLNGLSIEEAAALRWTDVDLDASVIHVAGPSARSVPLVGPPPAILERFRAEAASPKARIWADAEGNPLAIDDLRALVTCAAYDSGLSDPQDITDGAVRHTYIAFLVRQGLRLAELKHIVGDMPPSETAFYGRQAPPGRASTLEQVRLLHPAIEKLGDRSRGA